MYSSFKYCVSFGLALATLTIGGSAVAQVSPGCFVAPARMAETDIAAFLAQPASLLSDFPAAGLPMSSKVRGLTGSSTAVLDPMMELVARANSPQKSAIGAGLARAVKSCQVTTPEYVLLIQQRVAAANDSELTAAFAAGLNDVLTASLGATGAGTSASGIAGGGNPGLSSGGTSSGDLGTKTETTTFITGSSARFSRTATQRNSTSPAS
ncbi:hypothetical protein LAV84_28540 [Rhizobium sp. VS19-DR104.2]|uniref:hypothetical protein n=1 Tax=unclassified Rhizobium TaxID=2613769 RepID=UPI001CC55E16|nr:MULTISPECIES: hypothetical protein [unclassified Rhizobium]MBZ5763435.1 hypothetical protein [Rhizobium sp. VS19-DR96]MBZ5769330.1 hypothetical protein [Rhizobium sp. VS19-DR129.2]MBZ5776900.1 hypothetical protein [Rhizobium sp. VS19-DRK62.2]MBZ5788011.1 hypothetical protein [Rhizobium sp. VS19-DR121]MBZ5805479.1 hypothetical protein [Rhizobium sp. VS19-DR181]